MKQMRSLLFIPLLAGTVVPAGMANNQTLSFFCDRPRTIIANFGSTFYVSPEGDDGNSGLNWANAKLTLQAGVDTAAERLGSTVWVSNGIYGISAPVTVSNSVAVRGYGGASQTLVQRTGSAKHRIFSITNGIVEGLTIAKGDAPAANYNGLGVRIDYDGIVSNCVIIANGNGYNTEGGGVFLNGGGTVSHCLIATNYVSNYGAAGVYVLNKGTVEHCVIECNGTRGSRQGGGVALKGGGVLRNCLVRNNTHHNTHAYWPSAGGVYAGAGSVVENCTIVSNYCPAAGGLSVNGAACITNTIIAFNRGSAGSAMDVVINGTGAKFSRCVTPVLLPGGDNVSADPQFADWRAGDYRLFPGSPCIDAGVNAGWMTGEHDILGGPRVRDGTVEIGAVEFAEGALACNPVGTPSSGLASNWVAFTAGVAGTNLTSLTYKWDFENDGSFDAEGSDQAVVSHLYWPGRYSVRLEVTNGIGEKAVCVRTNLIHVAPLVVHASPAGTSMPEFPYNTWAKATPRIQDAIDAGLDGSLVLVTNGLYLAPAEIQLEKGITVRSVNGAANTIVKRSATSSTAYYRVFYLCHTNAVLEGVTICNGLNNSGAYNLYNGSGAGALIDWYGRVEGCIFTNNYISQNGYGAGVYLFGGGVVRNCVIAWNRVSNYGGGGATISGNGLIENCVISNNYVTGSGGGGGASLHGGGILRGCLITGNVHANNNPAYWPGPGGVLCYYAGGFIENCTIVSNSAPSVGGFGVRENNGKAYVRNTIMYGNLSTVYGAHNYTNATVATAYYTNCLAEPLISSGQGNRAGDPLFVNTNSSDYRVLKNSPARNAGVNQGWMADGVDLWGTPRIDRKLVDIGCYEVPYVEPGTLIMVK